MFRAFAILPVLLAAFCFSAVAIRAQSTEFTYQGALMDGASPANGNYDLEFKLFNLVSGGAQQGGTLQRLNVPVAQGIFKVSLDFGAGVLPGADRFLDIAVRPAGGGAFTALNPRQKVTSAPYSVRSLNSANADLATNATQLNGVAANQYVVTTDPRMTDARNPLANSSNYIQNTAIQQVASNFSISGNGTAGGTLSGGTVNANSQYNFNGSKILRSGSGNSNLSLGVGSGGDGGSFNSYFGNGAGALATGNFNLFVGHDAGTNNTSASRNTFVGSLAGLNATTGSQNTFVGQGAGLNNSTGENNSYVGRGAGGDTTTGSRNTAMGSFSGDVITTANDNAHFGHFAGKSLITGTGNSSFGAHSNNSNGLSNSTAIGYMSMVTQSNSLVLGSVDGVNGATADTNVGIGTTSPDRRLHVSSGTSGAVSLSSADFVIEDNAAAFQHFLTPDDIESGILFGDPTASIGGGIIFNNAVANNGIQFRSGGNTTRMTLDGSGNLGIGTIAPNNRLEVIGTIGVSTLGAAGATHLCRNASNQISSCSSPRPELAGETLAVSVEEMRAEITALKQANAKQLEQVQDLESANLAHQKHIEETQKAIQQTSNSQATK